MGRVQKFEDLRIWQDARLLVKLIYSDFYNSSDWGFKTQIQRAGISIMNNISEGFERHTDADFARFLDIAKGSCGEVRSMYYSGEDLIYIGSNVGIERRELCVSISKGIASLTRHLRNKIN